MNIKKGIALTLALFMTLTPIMAKAETDKVIISNPGAVIEEEAIMETEYIHFAGKIEDVQNDEYFSITIKNDKKEGLNELRAYISEDVILLNDKTMEFAKKEDLKVGASVSLYYYKYTPMGLSLPPVLTPDVMVINEADKDNLISVMVSKFDKDLLNAEKGMVLLVSDKTIIVDSKGNKVAKEELADKDLLIFYDLVFTSYPGRTSPKKIIVLDERKTEEEQETVTKDFLLKKELLKTVDGVTLIPLRLVGETLGYEVTWNAEARTAELVRGPQWNLVTIGEDRYNFARMTVQLGTAPLIINSSTYVPLSYVEQVLIAEVETMQNGDIQIKY